MVRMCKITFKNSIDPNVCLVSQIKNRNKATSLYWLATLHNPAIHSWK